MQSLVLFVALLGAEPQPNWIDLPPVRNVTTAQVGSVVVADVDCRLTPNDSQTYRDSHLPTWAHEGSHGLASRIRMLAGGGRRNGCYCLLGRAVAFEEPRTTLGTVAQYVPQSLRGDIYNLYMVQQRQYWDNEPLYVVDEWGAYLNGAECTLEMMLSGRGHQGQANFLYSCEMGVYTLAMLQATSERDGQYRDTDKLVAFVAWQWRRQIGTIARAEKTGGQFISPRGYLGKLQSAPDAERLRGFCRKCFTAKWTKEVLGF